MVPNREDSMLVVGAGFAGSVVARQCAESGLRVQVLESRDHVGGNAFDERDESGVLVHRYGPHIFHTGSRRVFDYLSRFTRWRDYEHRVLARVDGLLVPIPLNRTTINTLYRLDLDEQGVRDFLDSVRERRPDIRTSEDVVLDAVGRDLYEKFFRHYTRKQWGLDPSELSAAVTARIPVRCNADDRYFSDEFQAMPAAGYRTLFENLLDHPNIRVELGVDYLAARERLPARHTVFTGPIDAFYGYRFGRLPYRSLRFEHEHLPGVARFQPVAVVNYPNEHAFTRITEFKHLTGQDHSGTSIVREYPTSEGDPYYPVPRPENEALYQQYKVLARAETAVSFVGRLAQYRYYNMDQVVGAALALCKRLLGGTEEA